MDKNKMFSFIDSATDITDQKEAEEKYQLSDELMKSRIGEMRIQKKEACARDMLGKLYNDSLPLKPEYKECNYNKTCGEMNAFIDKECPKGLVNYISTVGKSTPMCDVLKDISNKVDERYSDMTDRMLERKEKYGAITESDWEIELEEADEQMKDDMEEIANKSNFDQLSNAIKDNVQSSISSEVTNSKKEVQGNKEFEEKLKTDLSGDVTESYIEREVAIYNANKKENLSLFGSILIGMLGKETVAMEAAGEKIDPSALKNMVMVEATKEYTKHSIWKALKMRRYDVRTTKDICYEYVAMK